MIGVGFNRGGMDVNGVGIGPTLGAIRPTAGPNGAGPAGAPASAGSYRSGGGSVSVDSQDVAPGNPLVVVLGLLGLAFILWIARKNSSHLQATAFGINAFNVITIGIIASIWIILSKLAFNKVQVPGVTPVINAI